jgi:signal peptidase II
MTTVTPLEPHLRRRDTNRRPPRTDRRIDRVVQIAVHREPEVERAPEAHPFSERALAARFFPLAALVVAIDLATKAWATTTLGARTVPVAEGLSLALSYNRASAGGVSLGAHTREVNFVATGIVVGLLVMLVPTLTKLHRKAWVAAALIVGAGLGNLASLASDERGVADFIALHRGGGAAWVLNVADLALIAGLTLLAWTAVVIARAARRGGAHVRVL